MDIKFLLYLENPFKQDHMSSEIDQFPHKQILAYNYLPMISIQSLKINFLDPGQDKKKCTVCGRALKLKRFKKI